MAGVIDIKKRACIKAERAFEEYVKKGWRLVMTPETADEVMNCPEWDSLEDWTGYTFRLCNRVMREEGIDILTRYRAIKKLKEKRKEMLKNGTVSSSTSAESSVHDAQRMHSER